MKKIQLHNTEIYNGALEVKLELMIHSKSIEITNKRRPAMVIFPGGGYEMTSDREAEPVALKFLSKGFNVVILRYSVAPTKYPAALLELASTISYIRSKENQWNVDKDKIIVCGFSAGGHLAGTMGVLWKENFRVHPIRNCSLQELPI
jgi:acetyl esterase/lipase